MKLLSINNDAKTIKGQQFGYLTGILYLRPSIHLCPGATKGCFKSCLNTAGHGAMNSVQQARQRKTELYMKKTDVFKSLLFWEIVELTAKAHKMGLQPAVRINGTSDIDVQKVFKDILEYFTDVQFYDYTKVYKRMFMPCRPNYHLTYSRSEETSLRSIKILTKLLKKNVAVVFDEVPEEWEGMKVINGDKHDLRFMDEQGVIVGLKAKGKARKDNSGFVVKVKGV